MENVIQKYLRNEFETIEEYNAMAGEVAEPFRVLVVANFPANFNDAAAAPAGQHRQQRGAVRRLRPDLAATPSCSFPSGFQLKDLEQHCVNMIWREGRLHWRDAEFRTATRCAGRRPPSRRDVRRFMHKVGDAARDANRVEVPFEFIAPKPERYWTSDSRKGVDVPLGRAGRHQAAAPQAGQGDLAARADRRQDGLRQVDACCTPLITNAALRYSPDELELYLIDFKKGVEFKVYAAMRAAARPGHRRRERTRVRPERAPAARRRAEGARRPVPRRSACRTSPAIAKPGRDSARCRASC